MPHIKKEAFLAAYAVCGTVGGASKAAGIDRHRHKVWVKQPGPEGDAYRLAFKQALEQACQTAEVEAGKRAAEWNARRWNKAPSEPAAGHKGPFVNGDGVCVQRVHGSR